MHAGPVGACMHAVHSVQNKNKSIRGLYLYVCIYIYIYIERERVRE